MIEPLILYTIPHSGTHFAWEFLHLFGYTKNQTKNPLNYLRYIQIHTKLTQKPHNMQYFIDKKTVCTIRHPHSILKSHLKRISDNEDVDDVVTLLTNMWDVFMLMYDEFISKTTIFIDCPKKDRIDHLISVSEFITEDSNSYTSDIKKYARAWKPVGDYKPLVDNNVSLNDIDLTVFDNAVEWYNKKIWW